MKIPQASLAFLDIGLKQVDGFPEFLIFATAFIQFALKICVGRAKHDFSKITGMKFLEQLRTSGEEAGLHHGCPYGKILYAEVETILDRPDAMPDLEPHVPERMQYPLGEVRHDLRDVAPIEHHQIDVGIRSQFASAITAEGDQTAMLEAGRGICVSTCTCSGPISADDQAVDQIGHSADRFLTGRACQESLLKCLPVFGQHGADCGRRSILVVGSRGYVLCHG